MNNTYQISFQKKQVNNKKLGLNIDIIAEIGVDKKEATIPNTIAVDFATIYLSDKVEKDSLCFTPLNCVYSFDEKKIVILNKDKQKNNWNKYKKKHESRKELRVLLMLYEELLFKTKDGLENHLLSSGAILIFCISFLEKEYEYDVPYKGIKFLWTTLGIPFLVEYFIKKGHDNNDIITAKLVLDEEKFAEIITNKKLVNRIKPFILKKEFDFNSYLQIQYDSKCNKISSAEFKLLFSNKDRTFSENTFLKLKSIEYKNDDILPYKTYQGKHFNKEEWGKFEEEEYCKYLEKRSGGKLSFLSNEKPTNKNSILGSDTLKNIKYFVTNPKQDFVTLYKYQSTMGEGITKLENGIAITLIKYEKNGWSEVLTKEGVKGFVQSNFIKKND